MNEVFSTQGDLVFVDKILGNVNLITSNYTTDAKIYNS